MPRLIPKGSYPLLLGLFPSYTPKKPFRLQISTDWFFQRQCKTLVSALGRCQTGASNRGAFAPRRQPPFRANHYPKDKQAKTKPGRKKTFAPVRRQSLTIIYFPTPTPII